MILHRQGFTDRLLSMLTGILLALFTGSAFAQALVVYGDERLPPYEFVEDGEPKGINVDLWRAIGRKLGRPVEFRLTDWARAQSDFQKGQGDALAALGRTPERDAIYSFSQTTHRFNFSLFVRSGDAGNFDEHPLAGRRIGVTAGGFPRKHFEKHHPEVSLVMVADTEEGMRRVLRGDIDAFAANTWTAEYFLRELGISGMTPLPTPFATLEGAVAVRRDAPLLADIDWAIGQLKAEGSYDAIIDRWAGQRVHIFSRQDMWLISLSILAAITIVGLGVLLLMARYQQRLLARQVAQRQENERVLAEEQVRLQAEIQKRILIENELRRVNVELERANHELEGFTFAASHDLKGPLGRINTFSSLLEKGYRDRLDGDGLMFLDFIRQNASRLVSLVDDLMGHARITQHVMEPQPIQIPALVAAVLQDKSEDIRQLGARVSLDLTPATVMGDSLGLGQALGNLVDNALKYSVKDIQPVIEIGGRILENRYRLWVRDNGIGFDMVYHDKIFELFRRLHTYNEYPGSGVGLALVKRAMERMGGRVWADSAPGHGSTFFLELELAGKDAEGARTVPGPGAAESVSIGLPEPG